MPYIQRQKKVHDINLNIFKALNVSTYNEWNSIESVKRIYLVEFSFLHLNYLDKNEQKSSTFIVYIRGLTQKFMSHVQVYVYFYDPIYL